MNGVHVSHHWGSCSPSASPSSPRTPTLSSLGESSPVSPMLFSLPSCHSESSDSDDSDSLGTTSIGKIFAGVTDWLDWPVTFSIDGEAAWLWPWGPKACLHVTASSNKLNLMTEYNLNHWYFVLSTTLFSLNHYVPSFYPLPCLSHNSDHYGADRHQLMTYFYFP